VSFIPWELFLRVGNKAIVRWFTLVCASETMLATGAFEQLAMPHFERLYNSDSGYKVPNRLIFSTMKQGRKSRQAIEKIGGASRDRTDDLIVANDGVTDSPRLYFQPFKSLISVKTFDLLERIWNVRKSVGSPQP